MVFLVGFFFMSLSLSLSGVGIFIPSLNRSPPLGESRRGKQSAD